MTVTAAARGLFIDLDGTLADSLGMLRIVYRDFLSEYGIESNETEFQSLNGPPLWRVVQILQEQHGLRGDHAALLRRYMDLLLSAHQSILPSSSAEAVLAHARLRGWKIWVVTSSPHQQTVHWLKLHELHHHISGVVGGDDVEKGKPDPEPYRTARELSGCDPTVSIAIEDSTQGALSAMSAGLPFYLIASRVPSVLASSPLCRGLLGSFADVFDVL